MTLTKLIQKRQAIIGMNRRNVDLVYANNQRADYPLADDKLLAKDILVKAGVAVPKTLARAEHPGELPRMMAQLREMQNLVVKPARGSGGQGILVLGERVEGGWQRAGGEYMGQDDLARHVAEILFGAFARGALSDRAFAEERINAHPVYQGFWQDGLTDLRIITLRARPLMAMVRVPTLRSRGKANLHQGGIGLGVDLDNGRVNRALYRGQAIQRHPENDARLVGVDLPYWSECIEVAVQAARAVPLGYLGVDLAVDAESGPLVLEINARPGLEIQNVNGKSLGAVLGEKP